MTAAALLVFLDGAGAQVVQREEGVSGRVWPPGAQQRLVGETGSVMNGTHSGHTGGSDHKFLTGQVPVGSEAPGQELP